MNVYETNSILKYPDFLAGVLFAFVEDNQLTEMETCITDGEATYTEFMSAIDALTSGDMIKFTRRAHKSIEMLKNEIYVCENMQDDYAAIATWSHIFTEPVHLTERLVKNYEFHKRGIHTDIANLETDWGLGEGFLSGEACGDLFVTLIGPINKTPINMMIPDFVAGFMYQMTGDNNLTEIQTCGADADSMFQDLVKGVVDIEQAEIAQAVAEFGIAALDIPVVLNACESMGDDIAAIEAWAQIFKDPAAIKADVAKSLLRHPVQVHADVNLVKTEWGSGEWFAAGETAADLLTLVVGPIE